MSGWRLVESASSYFVTKISTLLAGERGRGTLTLTLFQTIVNDCSYFIESLKINKLPVVDVGGHSNTDISTPLLVVNFLAVLTGHSGKNFLLFGAFSVLLPHALGSEKVSRHSLVAFCIAGRAPSRCQKLLRDRHRNACCGKWVFCHFTFSFLVFLPLHSCIKRQHCSNIDVLQRSHLVH